MDNSSVMEANVENLKERRIGEMSIQVTFIYLFFLYIFYRSLEVFEQYGIKHSELLKAQRIAGGSGLGGPLRYQNCILLWLRCDMVS